MPKKDIYYLVNINWSNAGYDGAYAELVDSEGVIVISATLSYIMAAIVLRGYYVEGVDIKVVEHRKGSYKVATLSKYKPPSFFDAKDPLTVIPRRPYEDDKPDGYLESDTDYFQNNREVAIALLDRELAKEVRK